MTLCIQKFSSCYIHVFGNAGLEVCLTAVFKDVCSISDLHVGREILGRGKPNEVSVDSFFAL